ncbi:YaaC family protein [Bacillus sp. DTU_2020_1000418_1_SI_GHA_SEK_038]|uniref:YaaC family protein n=1 Tax=Bacillus sp. DTU_2020_1000418_1_SI_GHA_SEK_038 TaxID=3077585 RepID=UPI0028E224C7|nr:YaaC family protein [Bacillus sp. DTU_2020_1000418_1_SI_GHA_SEK_038]WNS75514.1 YaaC family protein [Bacillus sp. DTU_2020_1000418_1_SI_GHA_SEK_038]
MNDYKDWDSFLYYFSASSSQSFLKKCYHLQHLDSAEQKSYENSYPFIYYLEHGQIYYKQAELAPLLIKPILLFYGLVHLIKACILTVDPNYPETTTVLAHGVSTRKRKKQQYHFFQDEVKIQKSGLYPYMGEKLFHMKHLEGEKTNMRELLAQIPELNQMFIQTEGKQTFFQMKHQDQTYMLPKDILDSFHMTEARFIEYWKNETSSDIQLQGSNEQYIQFKIGSTGLNDCLPIKYNFENGQHYFPRTKNSLNLYPELLIHYLLLYNLSMIARYETEWWSELIKMMPNQDFPFIQAFLNITAKKGPFLIYQTLSKEK